MSGAPVLLMAPWQRSLLLRMMTGTDIRPHETCDPIIRAVRVAILDAVQRDFVQSLGLETKSP